MPTLTFPKKHLKAVQSGAKTQTQRTSHTLHTTKVGAPAVLQFGARNAPTTLRTTITRVEMLDYIAFADRLAESGDPRGDMEPEEFHAAIRESGTAEERRMLEVAEAAGKSIEEVYSDLMDLTEDARMDHVQQKKLLSVSEEQAAELFEQFRKRIVILHFATPQPA